MAGPSQGGVPSGPPRGNAPRRHSLAYSLIVFVLFLSYYSITSSVLPLGAGPDYKASDDAVAFLYKHDRLAVLPKDEDKLYFSVYGGTRVLRPPLSYIVSAAVAKLLNPWIDNRRVLFRKGSSLLAAATVAVVFYATTLYFDSWYAGIIGALLFGLLPQFAFIASYNNDDSGAIFSATLVLCALVRILRLGVNWMNVVLLAVAGGLVILSKQTAWLLAPTVLIFLALYVRAPWRRLLKYASVGLVVLLLCGGWWLAFNVYHYGPGDPAAMREQAAMAATHSRLPSGEPFGYASRGVRYIDLLVGNYDNFWGKTFASTIGNLDWMRLRLGPWQYGLYLALFLVGAVYIAVRLAWLLYARLRWGSARAVDRDIPFEALLAFAILFQLALYTWTNMNNDVQLQGKYLLPVLLAALLPAMSGGKRLLDIIAPGLTADEPRGLHIPGRTLQRASLSALVILLLGVHADALLGYVVPFYRPEQFRLAGPPQKVSITASEILHENDMHDFALTPSGFRLVSDGVDPWFMLDLSGTKMCPLFVGRNLLKARIRSKKGGSFKIYVDKGHGIRESDSYKTRYHAGGGNIVLVFDVPRCTRMRIDPADQPGPIKVTRLSVGKIDVGD